MLDRHPDLAVANDTHFVTRSIRRMTPQLESEILTHGDVELTADVVESVRTYHRLYRLQLEDSVVREAADTSSTYRQFVGKLFTRFAEQEGKPLAGEKTPDYVRQLPFLHALFPWVKTIHIIRDGRDVAMSVRDWAVRKGRGPAKLDLWGKEPLATAALWWKWQVESGLESRKALPRGQHVQLRYEQLIARPQEEIARLTGFLGLPPLYPDLDGRPHGTNQPSAGTDPPSRQADLAPQQGLRNWRTEMTDDDISLVDGLIGTFLERIGYDRPPIEPSPRVAARVSECLTWWDDHLRRRHQRESRRQATDADEPEKLDATVREVRLPPSPWAGD